MIRISTVFFVIWMMLVAASLGLIAYLVLDINHTEAAMVALAALTCLIFYKAVSMRLNDRSEVGSQIADLSRGTADLARQIAEFGRRLAAIEGKVASVNSTGADRIQAVTGEVNQLGAQVKRLAASVANHESLLTSAGMAPTSSPATPAGTGAASPRSQTELLATVKSAMEEHRLDIYLQPMVTLPQRKVRYYEAMIRLRDESDQVFAAADFIGAAETGGLIGRIDHMVMVRCVQVLRRLMLQHKEVGLFCNVSAATLASPAQFTQCLDLLEAHRALAPFFVLEFKHATFRNFTVAEFERLAALSQHGYRFSLDHVSDLRFEPRELADRGVRFIKVPAALLLDPKRTSASDIHPSDLSDLLGRHGIDLVVEKIEDERAVVDLLDHDVRLGQGFLFSPPRPLRLESASATAGNLPNTAQDPHGANDAAPKENSSVVSAQRATGTTALARRAAGPG